MSSAAVSTMQELTPASTTSSKKARAPRKPKKTITNSPEVVGTKRTRGTATGKVSNQTEMVPKPIASTSAISKQAISSPEVKSAQYKRRKNKRVVTAKATVTTVNDNVLPGSEAAASPGMITNTIEVSTHVSKRTRTSTETLTIINDNEDEQEADAEENDGEEEAKEALQKPKGKGQKDRVKRERQTRHYDLVTSAARDTISILQDHGLFCAIFGSLACKLYGSTRCPKDADLLVLEPPSSNPNKPKRTAEEIKKLILDTDPRRFFLTLPRDPNATFRILHYRQEYLGPSCKVDILLPGTIYLPYLSPISSPSFKSPGISTVRKFDGPLTPLDTNMPLVPSLHNRIQTKNGFPVVPFSLLLLHKLQGWDDHKKAPEAHKQKKEPQDVADIRRLLAIEEHITELQRTQPWTDTELFCEEFQQLTKERVKEFCNKFPCAADSWQQLGFETS